MSREVKTPVILWICAAVCAHYMFGQGGLFVGKRHEDRSAIWSLIENARERTAASERVFEVAISDPTDDANKKSEDDETKKDDDTKPDDQKTDDEKKKDEEKKAEEKKPEPPKPEDKKPEPPKAVENKVEKKKDEEKKPVVKVEDKKPEEQKKLEEELKKDKRIAVRQHVKPNQQDNPNAQFIGDEANKVDNETQATQTSHDRDDEKPTPGGNHPGKDPNPGDSDKTAIHESEENKGEKNRAPGEKGTDFNVQRDPTPPMKAPPAPTVVQAPPAPKAPAQGGDAKPAAAPPKVAANEPPKPAPAPEPAQAAPANPTPAAPAVENTPNGAWTFNPAKPQGGTGAAPSSGSRTLTKPPSSPVTSPMFGLGQKSGPGQVNLNLSQNGVTSVVGADQLRKLREADGERRKSEHRGSWVASDFQKWKSAIENYVTSVKPGNQTALNTAAVPFATYLNGMHNRIHPIFADSFLASLDNLPKDHPLNNTKMFTRLEIVLTKEGHLQKMGIVKTSGVTAFDIAALDSVSRAAPFGPAPSAIISTDGNVYLHWEFHRDEVFACSTQGASPYLLNTPAKSPDPQPPGPAPTNTPKERGLPPANTHETREGMLTPPPPAQAARSHG